MNRTAEEIIQEALDIQEILEDAEKNKDITDLLLQLDHIREEFWK